MFGIGKYVLGAGGIALALTAGWGMRVDHLRAGYKKRLDVIRIVFEDIGEKKPSYDGLEPAIRKLDDQRDQLGKDLKTERALTETQTASIDALELESAAAAARGAENRQRIAAVTKQRDAWIRRARDAETRTERHSAEEELAECEAVLNALYSAGF